MSTTGTLHTFPDLEQRSDEWFAARRGIVTASVVGQLITRGAPDALAVECPQCHAEPDAPCISAARKFPTPIKTVHSERAALASTLPPVFGIAANETSRGLTATLVAERITGYTEPTTTSQDMLRGVMDEPYARDEYSQRHAPVIESGFMVRDFDGVKIGYSPDGMVGADGLIEIKSRKQKIQLRTFLDDEVPTENMAQIQTGLLVSGRDWLDYVSYAGGMPLYVKRVYPDPAWHDAILAAVAALETVAADMIDRYLKATEGNPPTERIDHFAEMDIF